MKVGLVTRISRSSRSLADTGSLCSFDDGRPSFPSDIFENFDFNLPFFFASLGSKLLFSLALPKLLSSALNKLSSTTLARDLLIKSSANETFGLGSRRTDVREVIDERRGLEFCRDREMWFECTSRLELVEGLMPMGTIGSCKLSRVGLG